MRALLALRYRLLWAQVRTRNGKIAVFFTLYLLAIFVIVLLGLGGFGAAIAAIRIGHAELVARIVLGGFFLNALAASVFLGLGLNAAFSDAALRRYPLSALQRFAARQLTAFLDPLWMFILALDAGLAFGFYIFGGASFWLSEVAALLLVASNYLLARLFLTIIERLMAMRRGSVVLLLGIMILSLGPSLLTARLAHDASLRAAALTLLAPTPPFAAARVVAGAAPLTAALSLGLLLAWVLVLVAVIAAIERLPFPSNAAPKSRAAWNGPSDRVAALFGPAYAPLVAKALRFCLRSNRVRFNYLIAVPICAFLVFTQSQGHHADMFLTALPIISVVGFLSAANLSLNLFGFDGPGLRRYFLMPCEPARAARAAMLAALAVGALQIPLALLVWLLFAPVATSFTMFIMLLSSAFAGLFLFQGLGAWTSILSPRPMPFSATFGNQLSLAANVVLIGGIIVVASLAPILRKVVGTETVLRYWWTVPLVALAALAFYVFTLSRAGRVFVARRERLLFAVEGRG